MESPLKLVRKLKRFSPLKINKAAFKRKPGRPRKPDVSYPITIRVTKEDHKLLGVWAKERGKPIREMNHIIIGAFLLCEEGGHVETIKRLNMERAVLCDELAKYIEAFGKIPGRADLKH